MTLFFKGVQAREEGAEEGRLCHAREGKSGIRYDSRRIAHVKKKKVRNDVCGAEPSYFKLPYRTRQKEKSKK